MSLNTSEIDNTSISSHDDDNDSVMDYIENVKDDKNNNIDDGVINTETTDNNNVPIILGIDYGTTNSCISIWRNNNCEIIPDEFGNKTIPSYVAYTNVGKYVGQDAKNQQDINPKNVFYEIKRLMGRAFNENAVQDCKELLSYDIFKNERDCVNIQSSVRDNKVFTPEEISALILSKLKDMATKYLKREVKDVVIAVPAHFNEDQRQATCDAAAIAGLNCIRMIHEPTAAALAYGMMDRSINQALCLKSQTNNDTKLKVSESDTDDDSEEDDDNEKIPVQLDSDAVPVQLDSDAVPVQLDSDAVPVQLDPIEERICTDNDTNHNTDNDTNHNTEIETNHNTEIDANININAVADTDTDTDNTSHLTDPEYEDSDRDTDAPKGMLILVYDLGGGTLDVSLIDVFDGVFQVLGSSGISHFGGVDFDNRLMNFCLTKFMRQYGYKSVAPDPKNNFGMGSLDRLSLQKLRKQCESAKKILSTNFHAYVAIENFHDSKDLFVKISRDDFENLCRDLFLLCVHSIDDLLAECDKKQIDIDQVILIGGMTRMPYIREMLNNMFRDENGTSRVNCSVNPDEAVSVGAAVQGYIIANKENAFSSSITLMDVTPLSLGVEVIGGVMDVLIKRNTMIPCDKTKLYSTDTDYVDSVIVKIFEGERTMTQHNYKIGEFELDKLPVSQRGVPEIEICFSINLNGMVTVTAYEKEVNEKKSITVNTNKNGLKAYQLQALIDEALEQETMDEIHRVKKFSYYEIEDLCSNITENINNKEFKLTKKDISIITDDVVTIKEWLKEKHYRQRELNEFDETLHKMKKKYGVLILQGELKENKVKDMSHHLNATTLHCKEDDEEEEEMRQAFEKVKKDDMGSDGMSDMELTEIKDMKNALISLCKAVSNIIYSGKMNITKEHKQEILFHIDDIFLWYCSHEKPTKEEYREKIDYINCICDDIVTTYDNINKELFTNSDLDNNNDTNSQKLEKLCLALVTMIGNKQLHGSNASLALFSNKLQKKLKFVYTNGNVESVGSIGLTDNIKNNDVVLAENITHDDFQKTCGEYINEINTICDRMYENIQGVNTHIGNIVTLTKVNTTQVIAKTFNIDNITMTENNSITNKSDNKCMGTSIMDLLRKKQNEEIDDIIEKQIIDNNIIIDGNNDH
jgi:molecular chaperone DnaK (HSP70)